MNIKFISGLICLLLCQVCFSQIIFDPTPTFNYRITHIPRVEVNNLSDIIESDDVLTEIIYYDGLGRTEEKISARASGSGKNLITPYEYDAFGRQSKDYLPYFSNSTSLNHIIIEDAIQDQLQYYSETSASFEPTSNPYSEKKFEACPLNRVQYQAAPGDSWRMNRGHTIKYISGVNVENEVKRYQVSLQQGDVPTLANGSGSQYYDLAVLYKNVTFDENTLDNITLTDGTSAEFKDKQGRIVLKRKYTDIRDFDTYYVYDIYGNLTYVIPPKAEDSGNITPAILDNLCYQYRYDHRNRMVEKKLPGKQWEFLVYDRLDRIVATGPSFNPITGADQGWLLTKYDSFDRVVYTGWLSSTLWNSAMRNQLQEVTNGNSSPNEKRSEQSTTIDGKTINYTAQVQPALGLLLTINYYDTHNFPDGPASYPATILGDHTINDCHGLPTGKWVRALQSGAITGETSYFVYDTKERQVFSHKNNFMGGYTEISTKYDFLGNTLQLQTKHTLDNTNGITINEDFAYSSHSRLMSHTHQIGNGQKELIALNRYDELGQLLNKRVGGPTSESAPGLQKVDYQYNIRGWLTAINNVEDLSDEETDLFAFKTKYDKVGVEDAEQDEDGVSGLYNGNICETYWRSSGDNILRRYGYIYDGLDRLSFARYKKPEAATTPNSYMENVHYDSNGNIISLRRNGALDAYYDENMIDDLYYTYAQNSNRLMKVYDATSSPQGFRDDAQGSFDMIDDYNYDGNGNLIKDENKAISLITYNHLNLPIRIDFSTPVNSHINYLYDSEGRKLEKKVDEPGGTLETHYMDGFQYLNDKLKFFPTAEGYVSCTEVDNIDRYNYVYNYLDHLGNVRLSYGIKPQTGELKILEENHYYPFGLKHTNYNDDKKAYGKEEEGHQVELKPVNPPGDDEDAFKLNYKYKYNGKEWQDELGLNFYDYGARNYDPAIGRWMNLDPFAEKSRRFSPYTYALNNPVYFIDPDGMQATDWVKLGDNSVKWDKNVTTNAQAAAKYGEGATAIGKEVTYNAQNGTSVSLHDGGKWNYNNVVVGNKMPEVAASDSQAASQPADLSTPATVLGAANIYTDALEAVSNSNADEVMKYGTAEVSAAELTLQNSARMGNIAKAASATSKVLGGASLAITAYQYNSGQISGTEASVDATIGVIGLLPIPGAAIFSASYFIGKTLYEYSTDKTVFEKPKQ